MAAILWKRDKSWFLNLDPGGRRRPPWLPDLIPSRRCDSELPHVRALQRHQEPRLDGSLQNARRKCGRRRAGRVVSRGENHWIPVLCFGLLSRLEASLMASCFQLTHTNVPPSATSLLEEPRPPSVGHGTVRVLPHGCVVTCRWSKKATSAERSAIS